MDDLAVCDLCGELLTIVDKPTHPDDPWFCEGCLRANQTPPLKELPPGSP